MTNPTPHEFEIRIEDAIYWADRTESGAWIIRAGEWAEDGPRIGQVKLTDDRAGFEAEVQSYQPGGETKQFPIVHFREAIAWLASQHQA